VRPEVWEFLKWQVGVGIAFLSLVVAYLAWADKRRRDREDEKAKIAKSRDDAIHEKIDNRALIADQKWKATDDELRALQKQMRALELELARNYTRQDSVEQIFQRFSTQLSEQIRDIKEEVSTLTRHLLEQRSSPHDITRRR